MVDNPALIAVGGRYAAVGWGHMDASADRGAGLMIHDARTAAVALGMGWQIDRATLDWTDETLPGWSADGELGSRVYTAQRGMLALAYELGPFSFGVSGAAVLATEREEVSWSGDAAAGLVYSQGALTAALAGTGLGASAPRAALGLRYRPAMGGIAAEATFDGVWGGALGAELRGKGGGLRLGGSREVGLWRAEASAGFENEAGALDYGLALPLGDGEILHRLSVRAYF